MVKKVAIVTGANRGLGLEIVRQLLESEQFIGDVYLTSRMSDKGKEAVKTLKQSGLNPCFHELDITQPGSIRMFEDHIVSNYGGVDILINNASVTYGKEEKVPLFRQAELSIGTDFKGTLNMCRIFWPHIRPHGRIVLLTNGYIANKNVLGSKILESLNRNDATFHTLSTLMDEYMKAVQHGLQANFGWPESPSQIAKIFIVELAKILARNLQSDRRQNVLINACCPGWTQTDGSRLYTDDDGLCYGERLSSVSESAKDVVWLATLPAGTSNINGLLVRHRHVVDPTAE